MREAAEELQISVQSSSRPEPEGDLQPPLSSQDPLHLQVPQPDLQVLQPDLQVPQPDLQVPQPDLQVLQTDLQVPQPDLQVPQPDLQVLQTDLQVPQPDLQVLQPDLQVSQPDLQVLQPDLQVLQTDLQVPQPDLQVPQPDLQVPQPDLQVLQPDLQVPQPDLQVLQPDLQVPQPDLQVPQPDLQVPQPDLQVPQPDLQVLQTDLQVPQPDLQVPQPDLQVLQTDLQVPQPDLQVLQPDLQVSQPDLQVPQPDLQVLQTDLQVPQPDLQVLQPDLQVLQPDLQVPQPDLQVPQPDLQVLQPDLQVQANPWWLKHGHVLLLFLSAFFLCAATLGLIYYAGLHSEPSDSVPLCLSAACQAASARLSSSVDPFTRPCHHFLFSCGSENLPQDGGGRQRGQGIPGHPQNHNQDQDQESARPQRQDKETPDRKQTEEELVDRKTALLQHLRELLETNDEGDGSAARKAKGFFRSCLDTRSLESSGAEPFLRLVQQLGGWAVSGPWTRPDFNATLSSLMRDFSTFPFFNLYVGRDPGDGDPDPTGPRTYIQIDQPDLLIPIQWNSKTEKSEAKTETLRPFLASCQRYLALLGAPASSSMIHVGMFISLSSEFAVAASPLEYRLEKGRLHHRITIRELQTQAPAIDWLGCLRAAFQPLTLSEDDPVLLHNLPYIVHMSRTITKWLNRHELSTSGPLHTFMILNLLHTLMPAMDSRFSETTKTFSEALGNTDGAVPRWRRCVLETERGFGSVLAHLLRERAAPPEVEEEIIHNVFSSFQTKLAEVEWSDQKSRQILLDRVRTITPRLWTSLEKSSEAGLNQKFSQVTVTQQGFFSNYVQLLSLWQRRRSRLLRGRSLTPDVLSVTPVLHGEELLVPLGMFIPPFFHPTFPRAVNYGATGFLLAKDLLHLLLPEVFSGSAAVRSVSGCVWSHYRSVSGTSGGSALSAAQQTEVWVQYAALQVALEAYGQSLRRRPGDSSLSGRSHAPLFLTSFSQTSCDSDPYRDAMPLQPSFLVPVLCAGLDLCPRARRCSLKSAHGRAEAC